MGAKLDYGLMAEGIVELDPISGRLVIRTMDAQGRNEFLDVQEHLLKYKDQEVRCIITPFETIAAVTEMVESGELALEDVPQVPRASS